MPPKFRRPPRPVTKDEEEDEDSFFTRNTKGWKGIDTEAITSPKNNKRQSSSPEFEPSPKKRKNTNNKNTFDWTKPGAKIVLDDENDSGGSDVVFTGKSSSSPHRGKGKQRAGEAARAKSITPPPTLSKQTIRDALQVAKQTLFGEQQDEHQASHADITLHDDDVDVEDDAELQEILKSAMSKKASGSYSQTFDSSDVRSPHLDAISPRSPEEEENPDMLKLKVHWLGEPLQEGRNKWTFGFNLNAPFRRLNETMEEKTEMREGDFVLIYDSQRIMLGATPKSLRMRKDTSERIDVYPKNLWDTLRAEKQTSALDGSPLNANDESFASGQPVEEPVEEEEESILVLNIRSAKYPDPVRITARKTATASKILSRYLQKTGEDIAAYDTVGVPRSRLKQVKLSFDGEAIDGNVVVGEVDADDEDIWDVVGL